MLLPMCQISQPLVNGFVPLPPYLERERPEQALSGVGFLQHLRSEWASSRARSGSLRNLVPAVSKSAPVAASAPSGVRIDLIGTRSCILPS
jgi:hypothetical protein